MGKSVSLFCCLDEFQNWKIANITIYYQNEDKKNQEATMTFENKSQLESYISKRNYPKELHDELLQSMEQVRECINGGADNSAVAIVETIEEEQEIRTKYSLNEFQPETDENIEYDGVIWNKKIFVFDDAGDGIILFTLSNADNKDSEFQRSEQGITDTKPDRNIENCPACCHENKPTEKTTAMFEQANRYMTKNIADTLPDELKMLIWKIIDDELNSSDDTDYLQVFTFKKVGESILAVTRKQEQPPKTTVVYIEYKAEYQSILDRKIFVIDDTDHSTMLYAEEY